MYTSTRKNTFTFVTLPSFSISGEKITDVCMTHYTPVIQRSVIFQFSTYIFSADITPEMLKLGRVTKVKLFFLVLVYIFDFTNFNLFEFLLPLWRRVYWFASGQLGSLQCYVQFTEFVSVCSDPLAFVLRTLRRINKSLLLLLFVVLFGMLYKVVMF